MRASVVVAWKVGGLLKEEEGAGYRNYRNCWIEILLEELELLVLWYYIVKFFTLRNLSFVL